MGLSRSIVYFAYLGDEATDDDTVRPRLVFMERQLDWLATAIAATGGATNALVPYVAPRRWDAEVEAAIGRRGFVIDPASIAAERRNTYEYQGFRALKALAEASPSDHPIQYCHSKGIVQLSEAKMGIFRLHTKTLLETDLTNFLENPALTRAGLFPSRFGWCWYNFFWVKAGYMAGLTVAQSTDRYHFEALIGDRSDREAYRRVLPLIDRLPAADTGIAAKAWYRGEETTSPAIQALCDRYAALDRPCT